MPVEVCPTDILHAAAQRIWDALTIPSKLATWVGAKLLGDPGRRLEAGDHLVLGVGLGQRVRVYFDVLKAQPPTELILDVHLPLGIVNHEVVRITPINSRECRVTFN